MVLLCDALIHHYLTIAHFLHVPPSAHHIIYLVTFSATFIPPLVFVFLEISVDNRQIHPFCKIHNHRSFLFQHVLPHLLRFLCPHVHSTHPGLAKDYFSPPCCCQPVEHTRLLFLVSTLLPPVSLPFPFYLQDTFNQLLPHHYPYPISSISSIVEYFVANFNVPCFTSLPLCFPVGTVYLGLVYIDYIHTYIYIYQIKYRHCR